MNSLLLSACSAVTLAAVMAAKGPCDIYDAAPEGTPCVAAHSTVRALYGAYTGPLYQVKKVDGTLMNISALAPGGYADSAAQDTFCGSSACVIQRIFDQSPQHNHLDIAPPGGAHRKEDAPVNATREKLMVGGHPVYAAYFEGGMGYRIDKTTGVAQGNAPETLYAVLAGQHYNGGCCFDYGNAESNNLDTGAGSMEAIYFGNSKGWGHGAGKGPWVMADLENGLWAGNTHDYEGNTPMSSEYVTAMVKGGSNGFALKGGDAQKGSLTSLYDGPRPLRYQPMKKQGSIILGIGGDNSDSAIGTFYEGVMTSGYASNATDALIQANIVAAGYGH